MIIEQTGEEGGGLSHGQPTPGQVRARTDGWIAAPPWSREAWLSRAESMARKTQSPVVDWALRMILAEWTGLEPATPGVTGRYSNQLNYHSLLPGQRG
jgi:hypothetical protein